MSAQNLLADLCKVFVILLSPETFGCRENAEIVTSTRFSFLVIWSELQIATIYLPLDFADALGCDRARR